MNINKKFFTNNTEAVRSPQINELKPEIEKQADFDKAERQANNREQSVTKQKESGFLSRSIQKFRKANEGWSLKNGPENVKLGLEAVKSSIKDLSEKLPNWAKLGKSKVESTELTEPTENSESAGESEQELQDGLEASQTDETFTELSPVERKGFAKGGLEYLKTLPRKKILNLVATGGLVVVAGGLAIVGSGVIIGTIPFSAIGMSTHVFGVGIAGIGTNAGVIGGIGGMGKVIMAGASAIAGGASAFGAYKIKQSLNEASENIQSDSSEEIESESINPDAIPTPTPSNRQNRPLGRMNNPDVKNNFPALGPVEATPKTEEYDSSKQIPSDERFISDKDSNNPNEPKPKRTPLESLKSATKAISKAPGNIFERHKRQQELKTQNKYPKALTNQEIANLVQEKGMNLELANSKVSKQELDTLLLGNELYQINDSEGNTLFNYEQFDEEQIKELIELNEITEDQVSEYPSYDFKRVAESVILGLDSQAHNMLSAKIHQAVLQKASELTGEDTPPFVLINQKYGDKIRNPIQILELLEAQQNNKILKPKFTAAEYLESYGRFLEQMKDDVDNAEFQKRMDEIDDNLNDSEQYINNQGPEPITVSEQMKGLLDNLQAKVETAPTVKVKEPEPVDITAETRHLNFKE